MPSKTRLRSLALCLVALPLALSACDVGSDDAGAVGPDAGAAVPGFESAADLEATDLEPGMELYDWPTSELAPEVESSYHRMHASDANLYKLRHGCYDGGLNLRWSCQSANDGGSLNVHHKRRVGTNDTETADNNGYLWGECVSLVKAVAHSNAVTSQWRPGTGVFDGIPSGTIIATFPGGRYSGHTAVFLRYVRNSSHRVIGMRVADQNWGARKVRRHVITKGGSGVSNASNYRVVRVP